MIEANMTVSEVAAYAECHRNTVLNYERQGYIQSLRDNNNFRRYTKSEAKKLKEILNIRKPG